MNDFEILLVNFWKHIDLTCYQTQQFLETVPTLLGKLKYFIDGTSYTSDDLVCLEHVARILINDVWTEHANKIMRG